MTLTKIGVSQIVVNLINGLTGSRQFMYVHDEANQRDQSRYDSQKLAGIDHVGASNVMTKSRIREVNGDYAFLIVI